MARRPSGRLAAVVLGGLVGLTAVVAALGEDETAPEPPEDEAPQLFLDAWARSQAATFRSVAQFTRTSNSTDAQLRGEVITAQRPPEELRIDRTGARGLVDGRRIICTFRDEELACQDAEAQVTYEEEAADQLDALRSYVVGDVPLYTVDAELGTDRGDCFELGLAREMVSPPLGVVARYCFDEELGAPTFVRVEQVEAIDEAVTVSLEAEVTDEDLDPATALD